MATNTCDNLRNVKVGTTDWKVKVRIIRQWNVVTRTGQIYKGYNLLLLDSKVILQFCFTFQVNKVVENSFVVSYFLYTEL